MVIEGRRKHKIIRRLKNRPSLWQWYLNIDGSAVGMPGMSWMDGTT